MKQRIKRIVAAVLAMVVICSVNITASAQQNNSNGLILSANSLTLTEGASTTLVAALPEGLDASRLTCVSADPNIATITPVVSVSHVANFQVNYAGNGSTVVAIYHMDNPAVVAYANIQTSSIIMQVPAKLGTNKQNYCTLTSYEFKPYEFNKYANFNDYKYTMKLSYKCDSYKDDGYSKWGCYGYFYDAAGNVISKVHLYCSSLSVGRVYTSEFNVPVNAVRFSVEGF